jgi:dihydroorotate dehydrogenase (fumarate)
MVMPNLETNFMGLTLRNPLIAASSGLTGTLEQIVQLEKSGIGAVVIKSLFEEQISNETNFLLHQNMQQNGNPEASAYIAGYTRENSLQHHLELIRSSKAAVTIPVIASINCFSGEEWVKYASEFENAGADGIEVNAFILPAERRSTSADIEFRYLDILTEIRKRVKIPVAMKIGSNFTNLVSMVDRLKANGASAVVLFNRFYEPDIDIETLTFGTAPIYSSQLEIYRTMRWMGILSGKVKNIDLVASTGIHDGAAVVKMLLTGATAVQLCSTLYLNGLSQTDHLLKYLGDFMKKKGYHAVSDFRGSMNYSAFPNHAIYERAQFMKYFSGHKNL